MSTYHIYGIGNALVDTEIEVTDADLTQFSVDKGLMTLVDEARQHELVQLLSDHLVASKRASGGSACNTITAAAHFGAKTFYSCKVAKDENGAFFLNDLDSASVGYLPQFGEHEGITGKCLVMITPDAERTMNTFLGISETVGIDQLHVPAVAQSQYVYLEGYLCSSEPGKKAAITLKEEAEKAGVKTAITLSDPAMVKFFGDALREMIGTGVDLLFCNESEAMEFTQTESLDDAIDALKQYAKAFAITQGSKGATIFDGENRIQLPAHSVTAIDSNGAGDMFAGAFLYALTHGYSYEQAGKLACLSASTVVAHFGPRLPAPMHSELKKQVLG
ncbi:adenosine kinase [Marinibactrum halimedae]|uniref:Adenosine kinase n=1 Tax=Marinibactrum halimedae TaxID=1444977 RepID=A0AA37T6U3_9GAMM|nr:adenosine kinase [Marinibactrum halimedae]MCD9460506.1 adenosine kinase [Marinibactrum halimedae]GLS27869.1 adenosine kinase [Marinibactrum halimedae]